MARREYKGAAVQTTLASSITSGATSLTLTEYTGWPTGSFTMIIDPGLSSEEKILCTSRTTGSVTITTRGYDDTTAAAHSAGAICYPAPTAKDFDEANSHVNETTTAHGLTLANIVKTTDSAVVTSTMITNDTIVDGDINTAAAIAWTKIAPSATVSATELEYVNGVTSAIQTQIDTKLATATASSTYAPLASPALTGVPTAPTAAANTNTTQVATTAFVQTELTDLIGGAPGALDTLNELAAALANDASYSTTITTALAGKLALAGGTMTGAIAMGTSKITGMGDPTLAQDAATKNYVDTITVAPSNLTGPITSVGSATSIASQTGTGTKFVMEQSPTLVTPNIGVATATSINGTTIPNTKTLVATTDKLSALSGTTSAELAGVISDETGSGALVFGTSPTLTSPTLNTPVLPLLTATGDIIYASSANTPARLAAGTDGYVLTATGAGSAPAWEAIPSSTPAFVGAIATRNANLSVANVTAVAITLPDELKDTNGFHSASGSSFTIPSGKAGVYEFSASYSLDGLAANYAEVRWYLNGAAINAGTTGLVSGITNRTTTPYGTLAHLVIELIVGDYVEAFAYHASGSTQNVTNARVSCTYLGA